MGIFIKIINTTNKWIEKVVSPFIILMAAIILFEVIARYIFNAPTIWAHESATMCFIFYTCMSGGCVLLNGGHVKMDIFYNRLTPRKRAILDLCSSWLFFLFSGALLWKSSEFAWESLVGFERSNTLFAPPLFPIKLMIPVAALLLLLQGIAKFMQDLRVAFFRQGTQNV